jgi:hypothetical protein
MAGKRGGIWGLHWLAAGVIIAPVTAVWNAWVPPIEILR